MKLMLLSLLLVASACGKPIDPAIQPYVDRFQADGNVSTASITAQFADSSAFAPRVAGNCDNHGNIKISKQIWDSFSDASREIMIYHELGHCVLNRQHKLDQNNHAIPLSIMFPDSLDPKIYEQNRAAYVAELFTGVSK